MRISFLRKKTSPVSTVTEAAAGPVAGVVYRVMPEKFYVKIIRLRFWTVPKLWGLAALIVIGLVALTYWLLASATPPALPSTEPVPEVVVPSVEPDSSATLPTIVDDAAIVPVDPESLGASLPAVLPSAPDTDNDGLTDDEEVILGTDAKKPDTDGDGYADRVEFMGGYNPTGTGQFASTTVFTSYDDALGRFRVPYPATWTAVPGENGAVQFVSPSGEGVAILAQANSSALPLAAWYAAFTTVPPDGVTTSTYGANTGIISPDQNTMYLVEAGQPNVVFMLTLTTGGRATVSFRTLFAYMVNNVVILNP